MPLHMFLWHTITIQIAINQDSYVATSEEVLNIRWSSSNIWREKIILRCVASPLKPIIGAEACEEALKVILKLKGTV